MSDLILIKLDSYQRMLHEKKFICHLSIKYVLNQMLYFAAYVKSMMVTTVEHI